MRSATYDEKMTEKELQFIASILAQESVGYFRALRLMMIVAFGITLIVVIVASVVAPKNDLEKNISISNYIIGGAIALVLLLTATIYGKKKFSSKYKADLKHGLKTIIPIRVQNKQFVAHTQTYHFHLNYPGLITIEVSSLDFNNIESGDIIHVELAKYSQTYLGYF